MGPLSNAVRELIIDTSSTFRRGLTHAPERRCQEEEEEEGHKPCACAGTRSALSKPMPFIRFHKLRHRTRGRSLPSPSRSSTQNHLPQPRQMPAHPRTPYLVTCLPFRVLCAFFEQALRVSSQSPVRYVRITLRSVGSTWYLVFGLLSSGLAITSPACTNW